MELGSEAESLSGDPATIGQADRPIVAYWNRQRVLLPH